MDYRNGKLHISWCYRNFVAFPESASTNAHKQQAGPNGPENNHDLNYAFSDDLGETWKNSDGKTIAALETSILPGAEGVRVFEIPMGSGILNQEAQTADWEGGFWALNREKVDGKERWAVYRKDVEGTFLTSWLKWMLTFQRKVDETYRTKSLAAHRDWLEGKHVCGQTEQRVPHSAREFGFKSKYHARA
jgi:hypothetical protein